MPKSTSDSTPSFIEEILRGRGLHSTADIRGFLFPSESHLYPALEFPELDRVVDRLLEAGTRQERVGIHGDADPDGMTGAALLEAAVGLVGAIPHVYIPDRLTDGHGISDQGINQLAEAGATLLLTADTGTTSYEAVVTARTRGMDVIVTDHHEVPAGKLDAYALLNPKLGYRWPHLAGAGVALKVVLAVAQRSNRAVPDDVFALAAIGTVADMVPLIDENRHIVAAGLRELSAPRSPGLRVLLARLAPEGVAVNETLLGTRLAPVLGCPQSQRGQNPAYSLLTAESEEAASSFLEQAIALRQARRQAQHEALALVDRAIAQTHADAPGPSLVIDVPECDPLALGYSAGRIQSRLERPVIVLSRRGDIALAEARGPLGIDFPAAFATIAALLIQFGGHKPAAGFTAKTEHLPAIIPALREALAAQEAAWRGLVPDHPTAEASLSFHELDPTAWSALESLRPFGKGNPAPVLAHSASLQNTIEDDGESMRLMEGGRPVRGASSELTEQLRQALRGHRSPLLLWSPIPENDGKLAVEIRTLDTLDAGTGA